jgi:hypothetical protein
MAQFTLETVDGSDTVNVSVTLLGPKSLSAKTGEPHSHGYNLAKIRETFALKVSLSSN